MIVYRMEFKRLSGPVYGKVTTNCTQNVAPETLGIRFGISFLFLQPANEVVGR